MTARHFDDGTKLGRTARAHKRRGDAKARQAKRKAAREAKRVLRTLSLFN